MTEWFRTWIAKVAKDFVTCFITKDRWKYIVKGLGNTLQIALAAVLLGILIGTIVAIIRSTHDKTHETVRPGPGRTLLNIANWLCKVYLTVIRGTPAMIQILIMFFVVFSVVLLCMVKNWVSMSLSFSNWFQLLEKSWKATTQKFLKNVTLSKKSLRAKKSHLLVLFTQVNTLLKAS